MGKSATKDGRFTKGQVPWNKGRKVRQEKNCWEVGCSRPHKSFGLCSLHYKRIITGVPIDKPLRVFNQGECSVDRCRNRAGYLGHCNKHYQRLRKTGTTDTLIKEMHGLTFIPGTYKPSVEYRAWAGMKERCNNPNNGAYKRYGGRGIRVWSKWQRSYSAFYEYIGPRPSGHSLDRINNDGNYEPGNVRWATPRQQANNRRVRTRSVS